MPKAKPVAKVKGFLLRKQVDGIPNVVLLAGGAAALWWWWNRRQSQAAGCPQGTTDDGNGNCVSNDSLLGAGTFDSGTTGGTSGGGDGASGGGGTTPIDIIISGPTANPRPCATVICPPGYHKVRHGRKCKCARKPRHPRTRTRRPATRPHPHGRVTGNPYSTLSAINAINRISGVVAIGGGGITSNLTGTVSHYTGGTVRPRV